MQIIKTNEHTKYFCPMKDRSLDNNRCDGPKCMWWDYYSSEEKTPIKISTRDTSFGYCGK